MIECKRWQSLCALKFSKISTKTRRNTAVTETNFHLRRSSRASTTFASSTRTTSTYSSRNSNRLSRDFPTSSLSSWTLCVNTSEAVITASVRNAGRYPRWSCNFSGSQPATTSVLCSSIAWRRASESSSNTRPKELMRTNQVFETLHPQSQNLFLERISSRQWRHVSWWSETNTRQKKTLFGAGWWRVAQQIISLTIQLPTSKSLKRA